MNAIPEEKLLQGMLNGVDIPPCPAILIALDAELRKEMPDLRELARLIGQDVALSGHVMLIANSPAFSTGNKAVSVKQAVNVLGTQSVFSLIVGHLLRVALAGGQDVSMERFWESSAQTAQVSAELARRLRCVRPDIAYTFGLFHDCGIPLLARRFADYSETLRLAATTDRSLVDVENERHHVSHTLVGSILAQTWQLPDLVCDAIRDHHRFALFYGDAAAGHGDVAALAAISLIADDLVNDFLGMPQDAAWLRHGAQALDYLGFDEDELSESKTDILDELQEAQAYRS